MLLACGAYCTEQRTYWSNAHGLLEGRIQNGFEPCVPSRKPTNVACIGGHNTPQQQNATEPRFVRPYRHTMSQLDGPKWTTMFVLCYARVGFEDHHHQPQNMLVRACLSFGTIDFSKPAKTKRGKPKRCNREVAHHRNALQVRDENDICKYTCINI